jgi:hypothetical protein
MTARIMEPYVLLHEACLFFDFLHSHSIVPQPIFGCEETMELHNDAMHSTN